MTANLRAGVVGAGAFGGHHAAKYASLEGVILAGVFDPHPERAGALAERFGGQPFSSLASLLAEVDVVSIASPAVRHGPAVLAALRAGRHVYVEKPLTTDPGEADAILAETAARRLVVACGFQERAVLMALGLLDMAGPALAIEAVRLGTPSPRNLDVSVVMDLMIHDIDLALLLTGAAPLTVEAEGQCLGNRSLDEVRAEIVFETGAVVVLHASRVARAARRTLKATYPSGIVEADFLGRTFTGAAEARFLDALSGAPGAVDPLGASLAAFLAAVRGDAPAPLADGADGARALDLALAVELAARG